MEEENNNNKNMQGQHPGNIQGFAFLGSSETVGGLERRSAAPAHRSQIAESGSSYAKARSRSPGWIVLERSCKMTRLQTRKAVRSCWIRCNGCMRPRRTSAGSCLEGLAEDDLGYELESSEYGRVPADALGNRIPGWAARTEKMSGAVLSEASPAGPGVEDRNQKEMKLSRRDTQPYKVR